MQDRYAGAGVNNQSSESSGSSSSSFSSSSFSSSSRAAEGVLIRKATKLSLLVTLILIILAIIVAWLLIQTFRTYAEKDERDSQFSPILEEFLDKFIHARELSEQDEIIEEYLLYPDNSTRTELNCYKDTYNFNHTFRPYDEHIQDYKVMKTGPNYVEILLIGTDGKPLNPRVIIFYTINKVSKKINKYSLARLQPFYETDPEYESDWN